MAKIICFDIPKVSKEEVMAVQALGDGIADPYQQKLALAVISNKFSRPNDMLFVPGEPDQTVFLNGRAFVGMRILHALNIKVGQLQNDKEELNDG